MPFDAYLFDLDGTLIDSHPLFLEIYREVLGPFGVSVTDADWQHSVRNSWGMTDWVKKYGIDTDLAELASRKNSLYLDMIADRLDALPGVERFLIELLKEDALLGLVSHSPRVNIDASIRCLDWEGVFHVRIGNEDVTRHKPDPEGFLLAAEKLEVDPSRCVVFEDSTSGIRAGKAAGMRVVGLRNRSVDLGPDALAEADLIVGGMDEITLAHLQKLAQV